MELDYKEEINGKIAKARENFKKTNKRMEKAKTKEEKTVLGALSIRLDERIKLLEELREDMEFWGK